LNDAQNPKAQAEVKEELASEETASSAGRVAEAEAAPAGVEEAAAQAPEPQPVSPEVAALTAELDKTRRELERTSGRLDEITRAYSSSVTEQREFRSRLEREKERVLAAERGKIAIALLEIGDELDRALAAGGAEGPLGVGVRLIHEGLLRRLQTMGIERLSLLGRPFDPNLAEAVDLVPVSDPAQDDMVVEEALPGYKLGEKLLRPGRVRVARYSAPAAAQPPTQTDGGGGTAA